MLLREFLTKERWRKGHYAVDEKGCLADPFDENAVGFCLWGAACKILGNDSGVCYALSQDIKNKLCSSIIEYITGKEKYKDLTHSAKLVKTDLSLVASFNDHEKTNYNDIATVLRIFAL